MRDYLLPILFLCGGAVISSLIWNWRRKKLEKQKWNENSLFPIGDVPTQTAIAVELLLQILLWLLVSWAWLLAMQTQEAVVSADDPFNRNAGTPIKQISFFVDTSRSMLVSDSREGQTRLERAKAIIDTVATQIEGANVSLFGFTNQPFQIVPTTPDRFFIRLIARNLKVNESGSGTNLVNLLEELRDKYGERARKLATHTLVVLLSDGGDTNWEQLSTAERKQKEIQLQQLFQNINTLPLKVMTVGLGSKKGGVVPEMSFEGRPILSHLEEPLMQLIGTLGRGGYFNANELNTEAAAEKILRTLHEMQDSQIALKKQMGIETVVQTSWRIPLGLALIVLLLLIMVPMARHQREVSFAD